MSLPLAGRSILVTRPIEQAGALAQSIHQAGGEALVFPAIEIQPFTDAALNLHISRLHEFSAAVFISPNAARHGARAIQQQRNFPSHVKVYALGPGTAHELVEQGFSDIVQPDGQDTEALLALPQLNNISGERILIFRGVGGRALLGDTLEARGADVAYAECYKRVRPEADALPVLRRWAAGGIHATTITSSETLHNLASMLGEDGLAHIRNTPLFAPHEKIATEARAFGIQQVIATAGGNAGLLSGLITWFQTHE